MYLFQVDLHYQKKLIIITWVIRRLSNSLGQDIIYNMRNGKTKKTEFIQYTITTKRKIGYRLMLDSVNHLGHSVFNEKVNNIEIQFAELNLKKSE